MADQTAPGWRVWVEAARPRTLPASIVPVLVGAAVAMPQWDVVGHPGTNTARFGLALVVALALQVAVNFANDWFDGVKGVDSDQRTGPRRVTASGLVTPAQIRVATFAALGVAGLAGLVLSLLVNPWLLVVGAAAALATLGYSGGPRPYASAGLGEVFVFVFFGLVATMGTEYVLSERLTLVGLLAACAVGLWSVALLVVNNLRDIPTDQVAGKRTLAVRIGAEATRWLYVALVTLSYLLCLVMVAVATHGWLALPILTLPLVAPAFRAARQVELGTALVPVLERTARGQLAFGVLLAVGFLLQTKVA